MKKRSNRYGKIHNSKRCKVVALLQHKHEFYMTPLMMRYYWGDLNKELYGQCSMTSRRLNVTTYLLDPLPGRRTL